MRELGAADRCWVVASLTHAGRTAEDIRQRLGCSLRQVRLVRAEYGTQLALMYLTEAETFANELRLAQHGERSAYRDIAVLQIDLERITAERNRLIATMSGATPDVFPKCGHARDWGNTWTCARTKKRHCRTCRRERMARRRRAVTVEP